MKNVLILSEQIPNSVSAGNIQLLRLFEHYKPEKLLVVGPSVPKGAKKLSCRYETFVPPIIRFNTTRFHMWKRTARAMGWIPPSAPSQIKNLLNGFQPDLVLSLMENSDYYEAAERFCRAEKLPLHLIVHDTNEDFEPVFPWAKARQLAKDRRIYRFAKERFCVSPEMVEFNEQRFGVPGKVLYPIPDPEIQPRALDISKKPRQPPYLTIGYAGSMAYGYAEMMLRCLPFLEKAGARLELCSPLPAGQVVGLAKNPLVKWHGYFPSREAFTKLQERCDVLWLPYLDPPGKYKQLYSTHFPSKLCDYLQAGMPVWVTGPDDATGVRWWAKHSPAPETLLTPLLQKYRSNNLALLENAKHAYALKDSFGMKSPETEQFFKILQS